MTMRLFRDRIIDRLREDLVGPLHVDEVIADRPTQRYSTGILYPKGSRMEVREDEDGGSPVNLKEDGPATTDDAGVALYAALKPSVAGLSFAIRPDQEAAPAAKMLVECGVYQRFAVDDNGREVSGSPSYRAHERWRRIQLTSRVELELRAGETRRDLTGIGIPGMQLYLLVSPHAGLLTVTVALSNQRERGDSSAFDEEQHFFQVSLTVAEIIGGLFAPRPSLRAQTDDDSRTAALIYSDVKEYVVGHTCSAMAVLRPQGLAAVRTEWVPATPVPAISDRGDDLFDRVRERTDLKSFDAQWLSGASETELIAALNDVVETYKTWIAREESAIAQLAPELQPQAKKHIVRCRLGADRMQQGIDAIRTDKDVRVAFQLAQSAMALQFTWVRKDALRWRPFQLAFQLLVLASAANPHHKDREVMDLLWFPTGGGKTEAYLALTAFVILLRRLRKSGPDRGGVVVLMRYTLRLLTIQQFQRAAAMICACELLRRQGSARSSGIPDLGAEPIGIGLWVGAAATPLTLKDAMNRSSNDQSRYDQLTACPCCERELVWHCTTSECVAECSSAPNECAFAASGTRLPVWTIDEEVYRHTPSLVIGTIDKFAQIVRNLETRALFGRGRSSSPPDLIIQDELHLISGPLGSLAGLYEVAIDELCRRNSIRVKIIGSTATIRRAEDQIGALFDRKTYQFPAPGLSAANSGFAVVDKKRPGRTHVGVTTAGRSATYMLQALVASLLQSATESGSTEDERNYYWTLVAYFNSLRELGRALVLMQDDVPVSIGQFAARRGEARRVIDAPAELTSRVPAYEIRDMLARLAVPANARDAVDLLVASNMISVGMDIPRLGLMVVNSQPKTLAEYIQATSRVGRGDVPGLVVTMYNAMRARDRSHFETFETWHCALYRDVEATSVTPFASRAQDKALHAVLVALVRHTVPGMDRRPVLSDLKRPDVERISALIESRVASIDAPERTVVAQKLKKLIDEWASRPDLQKYWDDYGRSTSLLMSAEQFAARADVDEDLDPEGARRALWPTPNSMREVEAGAPYVLRAALKSAGNGGDA